MSKPSHFSDREQMFQAAEVNNQKTIEHLVNNGKIEVNIVDYNGRTAAHIAAMYGHVNIVEFLLTKDPSILDMIDKSEETILMKAITYGHLNVVKYLVENWKVSITQRFGYRHFGDTAIHHATKYNQLEVLKYFIEDKNGDVNIENDFRETPLFFAAENKLYRIVQYLIEESHADATKINSKGHNILFKAVQNDDLGFIKYLVDLRQIPFDLNWRSFTGDTLVHHAAELNRENILLYLVNEKHADVNIADEMGDTALHKAAARNNYRVCRLLIEHGADTGVKNENNQRPVQLAKDGRLIWFLRNYASARNRRSVPQPIISHSPVNPYRKFAGNFKEYLENEEKSTSIPTVDDGFLQLQSILAMVKFITGTFKHSLLSSRGDFQAVDAVRGLPKFKNDRKNHYNY